MPLNPNKLRDLRVDHRMAEKKGTYMRKRIEVSKETEREKDSKGKTNRSGWQRTSRLKIEMYQMQINNRFWLAGRKSNRKAVRGNSRQWDTRCENYGPCFVVSSANSSHTRHEAVKTEPVSKHTRELQQKM